MHCSDDMPVLKLGHCRCVVIGAPGELSFLSLPCVNLVSFVDETRLHRSKLRDINLTLNH